MKLLISNLLILWFVAILLMFGLGPHSVDLPSTQKRGQVIAVTIFVLAILISVGQVSGLIPLVP